MSLLWPLLLAAVPSVTVGPDDAARAPVIAAPIARVTVFEERARVLRRGAIDTPAGASTWRLPDLPGLTDVGALRATVSGAGQLLRLEAAPVDRERLRLEPAALLLDRLEAHDDGLRRLDAEHALLGQRSKLLSSLAPAPSVDEARREGRPAAGLYAEAWVRTASALSAERARVAERQRAIEAERRTRLAERTLIAQQLAALDLGGLTERVVEVLVVIEGARPGQTTVELEYFVPGARWRPAYELRFFADEGKAELAAYGLVTQATGEDWTDVELALSTALPSVGIALPSLLTWTLGEAKEWRPVVYPRRTPPVVPLFALPTARPTRTETTRVVEKSVLMSRLGQAAQYDFADEEIAGNLVRPDGSSAKKAGESRERSARPVTPTAGSYAPPPAPPPPPPPAELAPGAQLERLMPRQEALATVSIASTADDSGGRESVAWKALALFEAPPPPSFVPPPDAPAALAAGLDHVYTAATRATVPSTGEAFRAPLGRETHPVTAFYEATPALAPQAYLRATVTNRSPRPILGGPVGIFLGPAYAGDGTLATTGAGGALALPLGGDEDVRVSRKMLLSTETKGVFSKDELTTYQVQLEVASFKKKPVRVVVREPLPIAGHEDVEVKLISTTPATAAPDEDGVVTWTVEVAPGQVAKLELSYRIRRPADFQLYQR